MPLSILTLVSDGYRRHVDASELRHFSHSAFIFLFFWLINIDVDLYLSIRMIASFYEELVHSFDHITHSHLNILCSSNCWVISSFIHRLRQLWQFLVRWRKCSQCARGVVVAGLTLLIKWTFFTIHRMGKRQQIFGVHSGSAWIPMTTNSMRRYSLRSVNSLIPNDRTAISPLFTEKPKRHWMLF